MKDYYSRKLSAERLRRCYEVAPARTRRYLRAEVEFVLDRMPPSSSVLELGCGYGRVLVELARKASSVFGVDTSLESLAMARETMPGSSAWRLAGMNAVDLAFRDGTFDTVICIQNGLSAFKVDQRRVIEEAIRVTRPGGRALFSSYAGKFWDHRLEWVRIQSEHGLLGEIDREATHDGVIVCKDGFRATTVGPDEFAILTSGLNVATRITEVDGSSVFCEMLVPQAAFAAPPKRRFD
ncbi:MAG: class I SAM-dependent methyltransferase [Candidatus Eisenbacteria bacterium]|nr:class I SAM-dependent methyltransferase [Candidatus Eisenbacteria bacterium]